MMITLWTVDGATHRTADAETIRAMMSHVNHPPTWISVNGGDEVQLYIRTDTIVKVEFKSD